MCQVAIKIPDAVLYDTHMTEYQAAVLARKIIALNYYSRMHISLGYCAQIANMTEEDFITYLGENGISVFQFDNEQEFIDEMNNA